jgi:hypothetical protein
MQTEHSEPENSPFPVEALRHQLVMLDQIAETSGAAEEAPMFFKLFRLSLDGIVAQMQAANGWLLDLAESLEEGSRFEELLDYAETLLAICQPLREKKGPNGEDLGWRDIRERVKTFRVKLDELAGPEKKGRLEPAEETNKETNKETNPPNGSPS